MAVEAAEDEEAAASGLHASNLLARVPGWLDRTLQKSKRDAYNDSITMLSTLPKPHAARSHVRGLVCYALCVGIVLIGTFTSNITSELHPATAT